MWRIAYKGIFGYLNLGCFYGKVGKQASVSPDAKRCKGHSHLGLANALPGFKVGIKGGRREKGKDEPMIYVLMGANA